MEEIKEGVEFANRYGAKFMLRLILSLMMKNIDGLEDYLRQLEGATGIIVVIHLALN